jgi:mono/diheme cytochrome c family protein
MKITLKAALSTCFALSLAGVFAGSALAADAAAGKATYTARCKTCHGTDGQGNAAMAKTLNAEIKPLSSDEVQKKSDADIKNAVSAGVGKMKPISTVTGADLDNVVAYVRSLKK